MYDAAELSQLPGLLAGELISIGRALAGTTRENICAILDVAIARATVSESLAYERLENMLFAEQRGDDAEIERDEAIARAEAAEARVAELINANNELARFNVDMQVQVTDLQAALTAAEHERNDANIEAALNESNRAEVEVEVAA